MRVAPVWAGATLISLGLGGAKAHAEETTETPPDSKSALSQRVSDIAETAIANVGAARSAMELLAPLMDDQRSLGMVRTRISIDGASPSVLFADMQRGLMRTLDPAALARLASHVGADGWLSTDEAGAAGFDFTFNPESVAVQFTTPPDARGVRVLRVFEYSEDVERIYDTPARVAAYLNYRASFDVQHEASNDSAGFRGLQSDLASAGRIGPIAFEMDGFFDSESDVLLRRGATRLIYDEPDRALRWSAGDITYSSAGFQARPGLGGLSVAKLLQTFNQGRLAQSRGEQRFLLTRPSDVDIRVNGRSVRKLRLQPGNYDARDFPFSSGANDVEIEIVDATGLREIIRFSYFQDRALLPPGIDEYEAAIGLQTAFTPDGVEYRSDARAVMGFYRFGFSDRITLGFNGQIGTDGGQLGAEWISAVGDALIASDFALSNIDGVGAGYAARVNYQWSSPGANARVFGVSFETISEAFGGLGAQAGGNPHSFQTALRYGQRLGPDLSFSTQARFSKSRTEEPDSYGAGASLSWSIDDRTSFGVDLLYDRSNDKDEVGAFITLSYRLRDGADLRSSYDTRGERAQLNYARASGEGIGAWTGGASIDRTPDSLSGAAQFNYITARADLGLAHTIGYDQTTGDVADNRTSMRASGALAFADGAFAIGRPLADSFAILHPHETIQGSTIRVGAIEEGSELARSGLFGPVLVNAGAPYSASVIVYAVDDAPEGYDFGRSSFDVRPPYRAGYTLTVGSAYNMTMIGALIGFDGKPLALQSGEVVSLEDPKAPRLEIFTNRDGVFGASGIGPGRWRLQITTGDRPSYDLFVTRDTSPIARIGALKPRPFEHSEAPP